MICCSVIVMKNGSLDNSFLFYGEDKDVVAEKAQAKFQEEINKFNETSEDEWDFILDDGFWESKHEDANVFITWPDATYVTSGKFETINKIMPENN